MVKRKLGTPTPVQDDVRIQEFLDMIAPSVIKFNTDHFICGNTYRCVWALREYPTATDEQAILRHLGEKDGVTLKIYTRHVTPIEEKKIISNKLNVDRLMLRQQQGFIAVMPSGYNIFGDSSKEYCLPPAWPICIPSITQGKPMPMVSTLEGISLEAISLSILTRGPTTKPMPTFSSWETPVKAKVTL